MKLPQTAIRQFGCLAEPHGLTKSPHRSLLSSTRRFLQPPSYHLGASRRQVSSQPWLRTAHTYTTVPASKLQFGQPVHETHPHVLLEGELTPGIPAQEYHDRRSSLASLLPEDSVAILPSATLKYRSGAVFYPFRQDSDLFYLTGFAEPESLAIIRTYPSSPATGDYTFHLLARPKDPQAEQWLGPWSGLQAARDVFNADTADDIHKLDTLLPGLIKGAKYVYTSPALAENSSLSPLSKVITSSNSSASIRPLRPHLNSLRAIKSSNEIACMRRAGQATGRSFTAAMRQAHETETFLAAFLDYEFVKQSADGQAYVPVVAGGSRGNLIHYTQNNARLMEGEMVLVDAGAECGTYISDVTRTWPVNGRFSSAQKDLYTAVLKVQRTGVALCRASANLTLDEIHKITETGLKEQLDLIGFDTSGDAINILFPHHVGHYVGLDVHDIPGYARNVKLRAGHCVTIEPGVYVPDDERWPEHFRGMAVRIEDSVAVDEESPHVLTTEAVKEIVDIEALREV